MVILKTAQAGTVESNDILILVAPAEPGTGLSLELISPVLKQYGEQIKAVIMNTLKQQGVADAMVQANDKGALDCTIRARVLTAVDRARAQEVGA